MPRGIIECLDWPPVPRAQEGLSGLVLPQPHPCFTFFWLCLAMILFQGLGTGGRSPALGLSSAVSSANKFFLPQESHPSPLQSSLFLSEY